MSANNSYKIMADNVTLSLQSADYESHLLGYFHKIYLRLVSRGCCFFRGGAIGLCSQLWDLAKTFLDACLPACLYVIHIQIPDLLYTNLLYQISSSPDSIGC
jgi:hypothetical protein